jgi:acyl-CoA thioesterase
MDSARFSQQTDVIEDTTIPGRFRVALSGDWNAPFLPHGGLTAAIAARAMERHLNLTDQRLRTLTTTFVAQVRPGEVTLDVTVLRRGRSMSQAMVTLRTEDDSVGLIAIGVFGADRPGFGFHESAIPEMIPPEECPSFRDTPAGSEGVFPSTLWERMEGRTVKGHKPWEPHRSTSSEQVYWYRFDERPEQADGALDRLALLVMSDTMLGAVYERMGTGLPIWLAPSVDLSVRLFSDARSEWVLARNTARYAGNGYVSVENELWDPDEGMLVAHATQLAMFSFPNNDVTGILPAPA